MKRIALIITNPGDEGTENYCQGVNVDNSEYKKFLMSKYGGAWISTNPNDENNEIIELYKPTLSQLKLELTAIKLACIEYLLVIFCGHGYYNQQYQYSMLELQTGIDVPETIFHGKAPKTCIILDSCRVFDNSGIIEVLRKIAKKEASHESKIIKLLYKNIFNRYIKKSAKGILTLYSCSVSQTAHENEMQGGDFSYELRKEGYSWISQQTNNNSKSSRVLSYRQAFVNVQQNIMRKGNNQIPQIRGSNLDYPFCIYVPYAYIKNLYLFIMLRNIRAKLIQYFNRYK